MALRFDPLENNFLNCGSSATLNDLYSQGFGGMTLSAWINPLSSGEGAFGQIINKGNTFGGWEFGMNNDVQKVYFYNYFTANDVNRDTNAVLTSGVMQHILVTWDGSSTASNIHIYVNGVEASYANTNDGSGTIQGDSSRNFCIGSYTESSNFHFDGTITEVACWNKILSADEIYNLSKSRMKGMPLQISPSNLRGYWPLDDYPGNMLLSGSNGIIDRSFNKNTGMLTVTASSLSESIFSYQP
jgi:hypothetical protein